MTGPLRVVVTGTDDERTFELSPVEASAEVPAEASQVRAAPALDGDAAAGRRRYEVTVDGWVIAVAAEPAARAALRERALRSGAGSRHDGPQAIRARIPGRVVRIWVEVGQQVVVGDRLLSVEAMKMENEVRSPVAGVVHAVSVSVGDRVELHAELAVVGS